MRILVTGGSGFIGTNLIEKLIQLNYEILNIDIKKPLNSKHSTYYKHCSLLDKPQIIKCFEEFQPVYIVHLAARTDAEGKHIEDYKDNIEGTANIIEAIKKTNCVQKVIFTSSQFVHYNGILAKDEYDYAPFTVYGESKVKMEMLIRESNLDCNWTIIRPTRVWGPWQRERLEFYKLLSKGLYIHPWRTQVIRAFGYVGNVVYQIVKILESDPAICDKKIFYLGDYPINLLDWVIGFGNKINNKKIIYVPNMIIRILAILGDILKVLRIPFPLTSYRYKSIITSDDAPMKSTFDAFGIPPYTLEDGINETVNHLKIYHPELFAK